MDRKQRAKKRFSSESAPATPATSGKKSRKRSAAQRKAAAEAQRGSDEKRVAKQRRTDDDECERGVDEEIEPSQNKRLSLLKNVGKAELVRRAVAHAAAAAEYFPSNDLDDDDKEYDRQEEREKKRGKRSQTERWRNGRAQPKG